MIPTGNLTQQVSENLFSASVSPSGFLNQTVIEVLHSVLVQKQVIVPINYHLSFSDLFSFPIENTGLAASVSVGCVFVINGGDIKRDNRVTIFSPTSMFSTLGRESAFNSGDYLCRFTSTNYYWGDN